MNQMPAVKTKEAYQEFLLTPFWLDLTARKKKLVPKCERCGSSEWLESHHRFYRPSWFDTQLEDLEVLCFDCHRLEHFVSSPGVPVPEKSEAPKEFHSFVYLRQCWKLRLIDRRTYKFNPRHIFKLMRWGLSQ